MSLRPRKGVGVKACAGGRAEAIGYVEGAVAALASAERKVGDSADEGLATMTPGLVLPRHIGPQRKKRTGSTTPAHPLKQFAAFGSFFSVLQTRYLPPLSKSFQPLLPTMRSVMGTTKESEVIVMASTSTPVSRDPLAIKEVDDVPFKTAKRVQGLVVCPESTGKVVDTKDLAKVRKNVTLTGYAVLLFNSIEDLEKQSNQLIDGKYYEIASCKIDADVLFFNTDGDLTRQEPLKFPEFLLRTLLSAEGEDFGNYCEAIIKDTYGTQYVLLRDVFNFYPKSETIFNMFNIRASHQLFYETLQKGRGTERAKHPTKTIKIETSHIVGDYAKAALNDEGKAISAEGEGTISDFKALIPQLFGDHFFCKITTIDSTR